MEYYSPILERIKKDRETKKAKKARIPILGITVVIIAIAAICFLSYHALDKLLPDFEDLVHPLKTESKEVIKPIEFIVKPSQIEKFIYVKTKDAVQIRFDFEVKAREYDQMEEFEVKMEEFKELKVRNIIRNVLKDYTAEEFYRRRNLEEELTDQLPSGWKFKKYVLPAVVMEKLESLQQAKYEIEKAKALAEAQRIKQKFETEALRLIKEAEAKQKSFILEIKIRTAEREKRLIKIEHQLRLDKMRQEREAMIFEEETDRLVREIRKGKNEKIND